MGPSANSELFPVHLEQFHWRKALEVVVALAGAQCLDPKPREMYLVFHETDSARVLILDIRKTFRAHLCSSPPGTYKLSPGRRSLCFVSATLHMAHSMS
jgi:hypothetical protein